MADDTKSTARIPIIVAIIGLVGTLTTVVINKWPFNSNTAAVAPVHCIVTGTVYNADNNEPMPAFPVGYTVNNTFHRITLTGSDGKFTANFSALTKDQFPFILFVRYGRLNIATAYKINEAGSEGLNIYISPKTIIAKHPLLHPPERSK